MMSSVADKQAAHGLKVDGVAGRKTVKAVTGQNERGADIVRAAVDQDQRQRAIGPTRGHGQDLGGAGFRVDLFFAQAGVERIDVVDQARRITGKLREAIRRISVALSKLQ